MPGSGRSTRPRDLLPIPPMWLNSSRRTGSATSTPIRAIRMGSSRLPFPWHRSGPPRSSGSPDERGAPSMTEPLTGNFAAASISVVVPVYRSAASPPELVRRLTDVLEGLTEQHELIFVEDNGGHDSWSVIGELASIDDRIRGFRLSRN